MLSSPIMHRKQHGDVIWNIAGLFADIEQDIPDLEKDIMAMLKEVTA